MFYSLSLTSKIHKHKIFIQYSPSLTTPTIEKLLPSLSYCNMWMSVVPYISVIWKNNSFQSLQNKSMFITIHFYTNREQRLNNKRNVTHIIVKQRTNVICILNTMNRCRLGDVRHQMSARSACARKKFDLRVIIQQITRPTVCKLSMKNMSTMFSCKNGLN